MNDSLPWQPTTWVKHNNLARRPQGDVPPENHRIFRVIAERHHRLWVHHAGGRFLLDYAHLMPLLPRVPSWAEWRDCWIADEGCRLRWPSGLTQEFAAEINVPEPKVLHELSHDQELYRPLRDKQRDGNNYHTLSAVKALYKLNEEQMTLLYREYAADSHLILYRLADLAGYVLAYNMASRGYRKSTPQALRKSRKHFLEYLNLPPQAAWLRSQYPTKLSLIQAGGIHLIEKEWLGDEHMKRPLDHLSSVL